MKKVLFITTRLIYPVNDGRKVVLYNYCKGLAEQHDCEVRLFSLIDDKEKKIKQPQFISKVYFGSLPRKLEKIKNLLINSIILSKWPLQVSLYYSKRAQIQLLKIINDYNPDIVICDMARTAEYLKDLDDNKYNKILDMDDLLSKRYRRQVESGWISENSIGAYGSKLPNFMQKIAKNSNIMMKIIKKEADLLSKYEINVSKYYKTIIFVSQVEAKDFNKKIGKDKSIDITIGVDYEYFSEEVAFNKKNNYIVFLGNMYVAHNKDAVNSFIIEVFPSILKRIPNCVFRIVGRCSQEYKNEMQKYLNVEITGEVDDIRKYVQDCSVAVAPLKYGSGIKTKILETMAMGVPIVTNEIGNEGIGLTNNKELIIAEKDGDVANQIINLLNNKSLQKMLIQKSRTYVRENHQWDMILNRFDDIL